MNQKQELARIIEDTVPWAPEGEGDYLDMADAILAAGYHKTRVIETVEELDGLTVGSVVLTKDGAATQLDQLLGLPNQNLSERRFWRRTDSTYLDHPIPESLLPVTVLWEPEA